MSIPRLKYFEFTQLPQPPWFFFPIRTLMSASKSFSWSHIASLLIYCIPYHLPERCALIRLLYYLQPYLPHSLYLSHLKKVFGWSHLPTQYWSWYWTPCRSTIRICVRSDVGWMLKFHVVHSNWSSLQLYSCRPRWRLCPLSPRWVQESLTYNIIWQFISEAPPNRK